MRFLAQLVWTNKLGGGNFLLLNYVLFLFLFLFFVHILFCQEKKKIKKKTKKKINSKYDKRIVTLLLGFHKKEKLSKINEKGNSPPPLQFSRRRAKLNNGSISSPSTLTDSLQPKSSSSPLQLIKEGGHELGTSSSERMTEGHGSTVDVELVEVSADFLGGGSGG